MKDYKDIWIKWLALLEMKTEFRIEILDSLHDETKAGFDSITKISTEQLTADLENEAPRPTKCDVVSSPLSAAELKSAEAEHSIHPRSINVPWCSAKEDKDFWKEILSTIEALLSFSVWGGYMLFMIAKSIDPVKERLHEIKSSSDLGNKWIENYQKDQSKSLISEINPILSLFLEQGKQGRMNQLLLAHPEITKKSYKEIKQIEKFLYWAALQGYILGLLEIKLYKESKYKK